LLIIFCVLEDELLSADYELFWEEGQIVIVLNRALLTLEMDRPFHLAKMQKNDCAQYRKICDFNVDFWKKFLEHSARHPY